MASAPLNIPITGDLQDYVEARVESGAFETPAEYIRALILEERDRRLAHLEDRLLANMESTPIKVTPEEWESEDLMSILRKKLESAA